MKQIQEWLRHSDFSIAANIYAHLDYSSKLSSAQAIATSLNLPGTALQWRNPSFWIDVRIDAAIFTPIRAKRKGPANAK